MKNKNLRKEYGRIKEAIRNTDSPYLRRDYEKHLKKLEREMKYGRGKVDKNRNRCF